MANLSSKRILTDIAGYACLLAVPLIGPLPGPGGIPLILTGLGLLSINNPWAKRLLHYVRERSASLSDIFFPNKPSVQWAWDIFIISLVLVSTWISVYSDSKLLRLGAVVFFAMATTLFLLNRRRMKWIDVKIRRRKH